MNDGGFMEKKIEKSYTIMVLPNPTAKTHRFSVSQKALKVILGLTSISLIEKHSRRDSICVF